MGNVQELVINILSGDGKVVVIKTNYLPFKTKECLLVKPMQIKKHYDFLCLYLYLTCLFIICTGLIAIFIDEYNDLSKEVVGDERFTYC